MKNCGAIALLLTCTIADFCPKVVVLLLVNEALTGLSCKRSATAIFLLLYMWLLCATS